MISSLKSVHALDDLLAAAQMARSTYYYHLARLDAPDRHAFLKAVIVTVFFAKKRRYGHRRIWLHLTQHGWQVGKKLVYKLMKQLGLKSKVRIKRKYNSYQGTISHIAANHLNREFDATAPNQKWVSDVSEFRVGNQKVYLSAIYDLFDHAIVSFKTGTSPNTGLTSRSLKDAFEREQPAAGLLVHTDQGFHYQHHSWRELLEEHGAIQSMSRKANCYDNALIENFFGHLKTEMFHGERFNTVNELIEEIEEYIDWYNRDRLQERLKGMTPMQYRNHALQLEAA